MRTATVQRWQVVCLDATAPAQLIRRGGRRPIDLLDAAIRALSSARQAAIVVPERS
jgi:hypothetical protein